MQIILTQEEIEEAIESHVRSQISIATNQKVSVDLKPTRGEAGFTAILDIRAAAPAKAKPATRATRSAPVEAVEEKPEEVVEETYIPETSEESTSEEEIDEVASAIPDAPEAEAETKEPSKGSIFNFAGNKAS